MSGRDFVPCGLQAPGESDLVESRPQVAQTFSPSSAGDVRALVEQGDWAAARERFSELVYVHQHRATRIAFSYLRDAAEADEAVQDAFVKAFTRIRSYRSEMSFDAWFTRILINRCLDRRRALTRRDRWFTPIRDGFGGAGSDVSQIRSPTPSPEQSCMAGEERRRLARVIDQLPERQRAVFLLSKVGGHSSSEVARIIGLSESTVRVHLFRAIRRLRAGLRGAS